MTFDELLKKPIASIDDYKAYVNALYKEWHDSDKQHYDTADKLSKYLEGIRPDLPPQFFNGKLDSSVVFLALNPHAGGDGSSKEVLHKDFFENFDEYWDYWQNFAYERYNENGKVAAHYKESGESIPPSGADQKFMRFMAAATGIERDKISFESLNSLGLEFIPLNTSEFNLKKQDEYINYYIKRMVDVLFLYDRKLVVIQNNVVCNCLQKIDCMDFNVSSPKKDSFKVEKKDGTETASSYNVTRFRLSRNDGKSIKVVAVATFAKQGGPVESYARKAFTDEEKQILKDMLSKN